MLFNIGQYNSVTLKENNWLSLSRKSVADNELLASNSGHLQTDTHKGVCKGRR